MTRRGVTLLELLVVVLLLGVVGAVALRTLRTGQRAYRRQTQAIDLRQAIRAAAEGLAYELRELNARDGDLVAIGRDSIRIRAMRQLRFLCSASVLGPDLITLLVAGSPSHGLRAFDPATDSLLLYYEGDPASRSDDGWLRGAIVDVTNATCPTRVAGQAVRARLAFPDGRLNRTGTITVGAPLRGFEIVTYRLYKAADGFHYVGQRTRRDMQPIAGPLHARGLELAYYDSTGTATADARRVAWIDLRIRGAGQPSDSLVLRVALRGNPRW